MFNLYTTEYLGRLDSFRINAPDGLNLDRNKRYRNILIEFHGIITRGLIPSPIVHPDYPMTLFNMVKLIVNGSEEIKFNSGAYLHLRNCVLQNAVRLRNALPPLAPGASGDLACVIPIDVAFPRGLDPMDTMFPTEGLTSLKLESIYGNLNDLIPGAEPDLTLTNCYFDVWGLLKSHKDILTSVYKEKRQDSKTLAVNSNFEIELDKLNIARLWLRAYATSEFGVKMPLDLADYARTVRIKAGDYRSDNIPLPLVLDDNFQEFGTEGYETANLLDAPYYCLNFVKDGKLSNTLDCRKIADPKLFLDMFAVPGMPDPIIEVNYEFIEDVDALVRSDAPTVFPVIKRDAEAKAISYETNKAFVKPVSNQVFQVDLEAGTRVSGVNAPGSATD